jgi:hypothetical protein
MRHAVRNLGMQDAIQAQLESGDKQWEIRENRFHLTALEEVNSLIRDYNNVAPYSVRKAYIDLSTELERTYRDSQHHIREEIASRRAAVVDLEARKRRGASIPPSNPVDHRSILRLQSGETTLGIWERLRRWLASLADY